MRKILSILLILHTTIYSQQEQDPSLDVSNKKTSIQTDDNRAVNRPIPVINFNKPLIFNPNLTPMPTQPAQIANIQSLLVYIAGAQESGPFGNTVTTNQQINAINNANLYTHDTKVSKLQSIQQAKQAIHQNDKAQSSATTAAGIAASMANGTAFGAVPTGNQLTQESAFASATNNASKPATQVIINQATPTGLQLSQHAASASATSNANQSATSIKPHQTSAGSNNNTHTGSTNNPFVTNSQFPNNQSNQNSQMQNNQNQVSQSHITNPNPFVTINNPTPQSKIVTWNAPLIIDDNNNFFNTISTVTLQENIIYKPAKQYSYPVDYINYPAAIIIAKDNITIDLAGFNLSLDPSSASSFFSANPIYGISILPGVKNTKIISSSLFDKKGSISGFSGFAVYGKGNYPSYTFDKYASMINTVTIDNVLMVSNLGGVSITNALQININNVDVIYNFGARDIYGIYFENVLNGMILYTNINQNHSYFNVIGIYLLDTTGIFIDKCITSFNRSLQHGSVVGMQITAKTDGISHNNTISNCSLSGNLCSFITGVESIGILINNESHNNNIYNNIILSNSHGPSFADAPEPTISPITYGIKLDSTSYNQIDQNKCGYNGDYGFYDSLAISTSFFSKNFALFNTINYEVTVQKPTSTTGPLPTIVLYQYDLASDTGFRSTLENIEVKNLY